VLSAECVFCSTLTFSPPSAPLHTTADACQQKQSLQWWGLKKKVLVGKRKLGTGLERLCSYKVYQKCTAKAIVKPHGAQLCLDTPFFLFPMQTERKKSTQKTKKRPTIDEGLPKAHLFSYKTLA